MRQLKNRLYTVSTLVPHGARVADIGTDHGHLPIYLIQKGISPFCLACDIKEKPLQSAKENIAKTGTENIETRLGAGLGPTLPHEMDCIVVAGMGGEVIASILADAPWVKNPEYTLILQPMTSADSLRRWLCENGFLITGETLSFEDKYYQTVAARYTGMTEQYTETELAVGRLNIASRPPHFEGFLRHEIKVLDKILAGKSKSENADTAAEERLKEQLEELL
jgi:tRNA (adenine22-N1)-methyltransferase